MSLRRFFFIPLVLLVWLAGCASPEKIVGTEPAFDRTGRFAVTIENPGKERESVQGGFAWHDTGRMLLLNLANPLGNTLAQLQVRPRQALLIRNDGSQEEAPSADALADRVLGGPLPVNGLREWLRGRLDPHSATAIQKNADGQLEAFTQDGWHVQMQRYDKLGPRRLDLLRGSDGDSIRVRLIIDGE